ncbi:uncharacterized protein LOC142788039 [Rhipicephalus microplus]|uniref:uncharacterized protein LOC142788039 n=1 Tax=Rhipicephalus microplus TaxID=6941 RepID=UPI003F6B44ED
MSVAQFKSSSQRASPTGGDGPTAGILRVTPNGIRLSAASKMEAAFRWLQEAIQRLGKMTEAYFEAKRILVPTVAEGVWVLLLAQKMVVLARDPGDYYNKVFGGGMTEEASGGEKLNEGELSPNEYSDEASGEVAVTGPLRTKTRFVRLRQLWTILTTAT